jgi:hypothetical protein
MAEAIKRIDQRGNKVCINYRLFPSETTFVLEMAHEIVGGLSYIQL